MIKLVTTNRIRFIFTAVSLFIIASILKVNYILPLLLISFFIYLKLSQEHADIKSYNVLGMAFLFTLIFSLGYLIILRGYPFFFIPFCIIPMLAVLLFNELKASLLLTVASALAVGVLAGNYFYAKPPTYQFQASSAAFPFGGIELGVLFLISGVLSIVLIFDARKRSAIIRTGLVIGLLQALTLFFIEDFQLRQMERYFFLVVNGVACSVIVIGILPIFEFLFGTVTNISLLELADFNHPLLRRLTQEAPGTYHHSLVVGNLSDAACQAVGANALLARIGAYYHDIGKLSKPEYFSENLSLGLKPSKHDALTPAMSKLVIMNHVKEGVELAKKYRLNPCLIDFIQEHHGNSLVYYFYRRALESSEENEEVKEEGFRYPGPKPRSKEAAIVLLADSTEAASRSLKEPTAANIEDLVRKVINNKFIDGQLDGCDLTLKELEKIASVFIRILSGIYHSRVIYP